MQAWCDAATQDIYGNFNFLDTTQFDLKAGFRFADFSYLTVGLRYRPNLEWTWGRWESGGAYRTEEPDPHHVMPNLVYGWSSEDDLHFPTHGSTLQIAAGTRLFRRCSSARPGRC